MEEGTDELGFALPASTLDMAVSACVKGRSSSECSKVGGPNLVYPNSATPSEDPDAPVKIPIIIVLFLL